jgi:thymidylate synthase
MTPTLNQPINHPMEQYHEMLRNILTHGKQRPNRTGTDTLFIPGVTLKFDMADGFPAITTKKLAFKTMTGELLGFFRGYDSAADFRAIGCKVWDANANITPSWLANPNRKGTDSLGRIYSKQWTDWRDWQIAETADEAAALENRGFTLISHDTIRNVWVFRRGINQLEDSLRMLINDPSSRRNIITGWRPDEFDQMGIPPCHVDYQWLVDADSKLHLTLGQRSWDSFLAFNIPIAALFLHIMAKMTGLTPGTFTHFISDAHIYLDHIPQTEIMLSREHFPQPQLELGDSIPSNIDIKDIGGVFERIQPDDIKLVGYQHHPAISAKMAA